MLKETLVIFKKILDEKGEALIIDSHIPQDGSYILVNDKGEIEDVVEIKLDKKKQEIENKGIYFNKIVSFDYYSELICTNKAVGTDIKNKKKIQSNNYLSFSVQKTTIKNGELSENAIDNYYDVLNDLLNLKYKKPEDKEIYRKFIEEYGEVDKDKLEFCRKWIKEHILYINDNIVYSKKIDMDKKDYLKIFFIADEKLYKKEMLRYLLPNIYNSNDYNIKIENKLFGLSKDNMCMNKSKPFLGNKSRKCFVPYLLDEEDALVQHKFFKYLKNLASVRKYNIYIDTTRGIIKGYRDGDKVNDIESGYYLRIRKGKSEVEICLQDNISDFKNKLQRPFVMESVFDESDKFYEKDGDIYKTYNTRYEVGNLINKILFFNKYLNNYYIDTKDLKINDNVLKKILLMYRNIIFNWVYKGQDRGFYYAIKKCTMNIIKNSLMKIGKEKRTIWQIDFYYALISYFEGVDNMAEIVKKLRTTVKEKILAKDDVSFSNDKEYFYGIGQLVYYLTSCSKASKKTQSVINPFLNARSDDVLKEKLRQLYTKYNYIIDLNNLRVKNLMTMVFGYEADVINQDMIILGFTDNNLIFTKDEKLDSEEIIK